MPYSAAASSSSTFIPREQSSEDIVLSGRGEEEADEIESGEIWKSTFFRLVPTGTSSSLPLLLRVTFCTMEVSSDMFLFISSKRFLRVSNSVFIATELLFSVAAEDETLSGPELLLPLLSFALVLAVIRLISLSNCGFPL
jgi:hypothetical protein